MPSQALDALNARPEAKRKTDRRQTSAKGSENCTQVHSFCAWTLRYSVICAVWKPPKGAQANTYGDKPLGDHCMLADRLAVSSWAREQPTPTQPGKHSHGQCQSAAHSNKRQTTHSVARKVLSTSGPMAQSQASGNAVHARVFVGKQLPHY